jgi:signal transduction histidine kinase
VSLYIQQGVSGMPAERGGAVSGTTQIRIERKSWRVVLRHGAGSLDAAVSLTRRRNLWLSFGILAVLSAGVVLVMVNARRSEQLAARQLDFVATVSHELRTPLAVIRSAAQNLSAGVVSDPAQTRRYGDLIEGEGRRLTDMVEQVLDYAGLVGSRSLRPLQMVDVGVLVDEVLASHGAAARQAGVTVVTDAAGDGGELPPVQADEDALKGALDNLVTNALKHGADGRWLGVTVRAVVTRGRREVEVTVSDRGRGIDSSDLAHVFEPFYRGRPAVEGQVHGNGLGLSLVKRIVEAHGGRIGVRSAPGEGATFTLHLPAVEVPAPDRFPDDPVSSPGGPA